MIGHFDNSSQQFNSAVLTVAKPPLYSRIHRTLRGKRPLLYKNAGIHLRLPKPYNNIVYVYIRKNGCSAFKRWLLNDMGERSGPAAQISIVAKEYAISTKEELAHTKRLLILRDPAKRTCSLFRNKFIQRKGASDILKNFEELTGFDATKVSFRCFVKNYIGNFVGQAGVNSEIDPHCRTQTSHLWPITYHNVLMLENLPELSRIIFSEKIGDLYFSSRVNSTQTKAYSVQETDTPASLLIDKYWSSGELPGDSALLDQELRSLIMRVYESDYRLIEASFKSCSESKAT